MLIRVLSADAVRISLRDDEFEREREGGGGCWCMDNIMSMGTSTGTGDLRASGAASQNEYGYMDDHQR